MASIIDCTCPDCRSARPSPEQKVPQDTSPSPWNPPSPSVQINSSVRANSFGQANPSGPTNLSGRANSSIPAGLSGAATPWVPASQATSAVEPSPWNPPNRSDLANPAGAPPTPWNPAAPSSRASQANPSGSRDLPGLPALSSLPGLSTVSSMPSGVMPVSQSCLAGQTGPSNPPGRPIELNMAPQSMLAIPYPPHNPMLPITCLDLTNGVIRTANMTFWNYVWADAPLSYIHLRRIMPLYDGEHLEGMLSETRALLGPVGGMVYKQWLRQVIQGSTEVQYLAATAPRVLEFYLGGYKRVPYTVMMYLAWNNGFFAAAVLSPVDMNHYPSREQ